LTVQFLFNPQYFNNNYVYIDGKYRSKRFLKDDDFNNKLYIDNYIELFYYFIKNQQENP